MGQYADRVDRQRRMLEAEEWAEGIRSVHTHSMNSMWYDTRPHDTENGQMVTDTHYNDGLIKRTKNGIPCAFFGEKLFGEALLDAYERHQADGSSSRWERTCQKII